MNQSKNVIINNVNTTTTNKTAEIKVDYKNKFVSIMNFKIFILQEESFDEAGVMVVNYL